MSSIIDPQIAFLNAEVKQLKDEILRLTSENTARDTIIKARNGAIAIKDNEIAQLKADLAARDAVIAGHAAPIVPHAPTAADVARLEAEVQKLTADIVKHTTTIAGYTPTIDAKDAEIARLTKLANLFQTQSTRLAAEKSTVEQQLLLAQANAGTATTQLAVEQKAKADAIKVGDDLLVRFHEFGLTSSPTHGTAIAELDALRTERNKYAVIDRVLVESHVRKIRPSAADSVHEMRMSGCPDAIRYTIIPFLLK